MLIPAPYKLLIRIGVVLLLITGAFATGWIKRGAQEQLKAANQIVQEQIRVIKVKDVQKVVDDKAVTALNAKLAVLRKENESLHTSIRNMPDPVCRLDPEWVHIYNRSVQAHDAATTSAADGATTETPGTSN
jgi:cell division protein FtsB